ncbi:protein of unknown function (plasmid) [Cupriavidus taiwanensis]|uniref:Uncharacterized protein n=1 Tax=Cupriavidus taiwanensis TaxID=164546 RepID=A0A7Z7JGJ0_9BURK|nr:protein of unknown function [Cupriavidus taiwanensis]SOZ41428.1 protein of unknown function [Cupriavidus taiwanensis]SPC23802.1 protein of unknown function [Cupriavidus taiwanensis]SPD54982.1 protein of unknown function [Cupriavidus taiwanensis]
MKEHHSWTFAFVDVMQLHPVDREKASLRWMVTLCLARAVMHPRGGSSHCNDAGQSSEHTR